MAIANAAYSDRDLFHQADMAGFRRTVDVTMWGAFFLLRAAAQQMIGQGSGGAIVVVSSPHAYIPAPRAMARIIPVMMPGMASGSTWWNTAC